jgi:hypothetical protein
VAGEFDTGTPTLLVNVYEAGRLLTRVPCESADDAAGVVSEWEALDNIKCEIEDLGTSHQPDDVLAPEPEDAFESDEDEPDFGDGTE